MIFTVSVVIPVYNTASFVREAVESALNQPEVLLVEPGSADDSLIVRLQANWTKLKRNEWSGSTRE